MMEVAKRCDSTVGREWEAAAWTAASQRLKLGVDTSLASVQDTNVPNSHLDGTRTGCL